MKEFLPKKWSIKITPENETILEKYWKSIPGVDDSYFFKFWLLSDLCWDRSGLFYGTDPYNIGYVEISFEEFKFFVLNSSPSQPQLNCYEIY